MSNDMLFGIDVSLRNTKKYVAENQNYKSESVDIGKTEAAVLNTQSIQVVSTVRNDNVTMGPIDLFDDYKHDGDSDMRHDDVGEEMSKS